MKAILVTLAIVAYLAATILWLGPALHYKATPIRASYIIHKINSARLLWNYSNQPIRMHLGPTVSDEKLYKWPGHLDYDFGRYPFQRWIAQLSDATLEYSLTGDLIAVDVPKPALPASGSIQAQIFAEGIQMAQPNPAFVKISGSSPVMRYEAKTLTVPLGWNTDTSLEIANGRLKLYQVHLDTPKGVQAKIDRQARTLKANHMAASIVLGLLTLAVIIASLFVPKIKVSTLVATMVILAGLAIGNHYNQEEPPGLIKTLSILALSSPLLYCGLTWSRYIVSKPVSPHRFVWAVTVAGANLWVAGLLYHVVSLPATTVISPGWDYRIPQLAAALKSYHPILSTFFLIITPLSLVRGLMPESGMPRHVIHVLGILLVTLINYWYLDPSAMTNGWLVLFEVVSLDLLLGYEGVVTVIVAGVLISAGWFVQTYLPYNPIIGGEALLVILLGMGIIWLLKRWVKPLQLG